jgi:type IV conjugative transfer system coupling protein TraD
MSTTDKGLLTRFLTGGDLLFNRIQYLFANIVRVFAVGAVVFTVMSWIIISVFLDEYEWYVFYKTMYAKFWSFVHLPNYRLDFVRPDGILVDGTTSAAIVKFIKTTPELSGYFNHVLWCFIVALLFSIAAIVGLTRFYVRYGKKAQTDEFLRGQVLVDAETLAQQIKNPSPIKIANIPIPLDLLARNLLAVGSMGAGKSQVIEQIIEDSRNWKKKMVIYDKTGEYTQRFFRPGIDVLLSPIDARCADWSIFSDLRTITDPAMVSTFFVPENKHSSDPIWDNAARMLLEDLIVIVRNDGGSMSDILHIITQYTLEDLSELLRRHNAPSCGTINPGNSKGSESVRLTLIAQPAVRFFSFFDKTNASFSVRNFIRREDDACLFLVSSSTHHQVARPFISAWLEMAYAEAMSMPPTTDIRLMFFLDELASLSKLKVLDIAFTEARKYGIVSTVGMQNFSQMDEIYGEHMTKVFLANLQNKLVLRTEEASSADRLADSLAKEEVEEVNQSLSFGIEANRDGATLGAKRNERRLVTGSEIMILPDMTGYIKISGAHPIAKVSYTYKKRPAIVEAYIERDGLLLAEPKPVLPPELAADLVGDASSREAVEESKSSIVW